MKKIDVTWCHHCSWRITDSWHWFVTAEWKMTSFDKTIANEEDWHHRNNNNYRRENAEDYEEEKNYYHGDNAKDCKQNWFWHIRWFVRLIAVTVQWCIAWLMHSFTLSNQTAENRCLETYWINTKSLMLIFNCCLWKKEATFWTPKMIWTLNTSRSTSREIKRKLCATENKRAKLTSRFSKLKCADAANITRCGFGTSACNWEIFHENIVARIRLVHTMNGGTNDECHCIRTHTNQSHWCQLTELTVMFCKENMIGGFTNASIGNMGDAIASTCGRYGVEIAMMMRYVNSMARTFPNAQ